MVSKTITHTSILKPSGAISIENKVTLLQRQLWNVLFSHAQDDILTTPMHEIPLRLVFAELGERINEYSELKADLKALVETSVEWNLYKKDKRAWGVSTLLASAEINETTGMLEYSYSEHVRAKLVLPKNREAIATTPYAKLDIGTQKKFRSKHTQFFYEFLTDAYRKGQKQTVTAWLHLDKLQEMTHTNYVNWTDIQRNLFTKPLAELAPHVPFHIEVQKMKALRKTTHIRFFLTRKAAKK